MKKPKITRQIEEETWNLWEGIGWHKAEKYLLDLGFTGEEISLMRERWEEGKSFYPYSN